ncbi:hypothetical protein HHL17_32665 [Chitinophaga sp. G-6-1-13]|uniref:Protochlamydia outer membrane protein domain-containing protein n=1 Tax=Chitinophaga fulva TaxID=2728842 RepID=A0A848GUE9_9BACT|nr:hypothetical protein [Chitinophaga fulva]NML41984.1 hypothetical protein [Chitinophaga fulva]
MKYLFLLLIGMNCCSVRAQLREPFAFELSTGYQRENFDWSIAGNILGENPNIYSELKWMQTGGLFVGGRTRWTVWNQLTLVAGYQHTLIVGGEVSDADYLGNNRTENRYSGYFSANKGSLRAYNVHAGYQIVCSPIFTLMPAVGYIVHQQCLYMLDAPKGVQSTYFTNWKGFSVGLSTVLKLSKKMEVNDNFAIQQLKFHGEANWNLVNTFQHPLSFEDWANGAGVSNEAQLWYHLKPIISLYAGASYYYQRTGKGIDKLYLTNGTIPTTQFNGAVRQGFTVSGGLRIIWGK